jgi:Predicted DNA-binding proteins
MPRPRKPRCIAAEPRVTYFKPRGIPLRELEEENLGMEEVEALRLTDMEGLSMEEAAAVMRVSRHTFGRILRGARRVVTRALVNGCALRIEGGHYTLSLKQHDKAVETECVTGPEPRD